MSYPSSHTEEAALRESDSWLFEAALCEVRARNDSNIGITSMWSSHARHGANVYTVSILKSSTRSWILHTRELE